ncbi:MAG TPA: hypothetical protein VGB83_08070 [Actinomycetota bacterium]
MAVRTFRSTRFRAATLAALASAAVVALLAFGASAGYSSPLVTVQSAATLDGDRDGKIDGIRVTFNGPMDTTVTPEESDGASAGFLVDDYTITGFAWGSPANTLTISLAEGNAPDTAAQPEVTYVDGDGAQLKQSGTGLTLDPYGPTPATDGAGPVLLSLQVNDLPAAPNVFNLVGEYVLITWSEPATLSGATAADKWNNLEQGLVLNNDPATALCQDGGGLLSNTFNFPQPQGTANPFIETTATATWKIQYVTGSLGSSAGRAIPGVPLTCWLGVTSGTNIRDLASPSPNPAATQNEAVIKAYPSPVDAALATAATIDGRTGPADGVLDAIKLTFNQKVDDATVLARLGDFTVSSGATNAVIDTSSVDTGSTANDDTIYLRISGVSWGTGVTPTVAYAKPSDCTSSSGSGLKAIVPTGDPYRACVGSFDTPASDGAGPLLVSAITKDGDGDGKLDTIRATFGEEIGSAAEDGWTVGGAGATSATIVPGDATKVDIAFPEGGSGDTGTTPSLTYTSVANGKTADAAAIEVAPASVTPADKAAPRIVAPVIVKDTDLDGSIDRAVLTYSEPIVDPSAGTAAGFTVGGAGATGFAPGAGDDPGDETLTLAVDVPGTEPKEIAFNAGTLADAAGNATGTQLYAAPGVTDMAVPQAVIGASPSAPLPAGTATIAVDYSEPMDASVQPTVTVDGNAVSPIDDGDHTSGWLNIDDSVWEGEIEVGVEPLVCAVATGCAVQIMAVDGQDPAGLAQDAETLDTEVDTIAPAAPALGTFSQTVTDGESAPATTLNMFTQSISLAANFAAADAEGGYAEILVDGAALDPRAISPLIGPSDTSAVALSGFGDDAELQAAIDDAGSHTLTIVLYDDAGNQSDPSASSVSLDADYTPIDVSLTITDPDPLTLIAGGDPVSLAWDGDDVPADFDQVLLEYSNDGGTTWMTTDLAGAAPAEGMAIDGSDTWSAPSDDTSGARLRATTVDANGNKGYGASDPFTIDSSPPVLALTAPRTSDRFLPAGEEFEITWTVSDASIGQVAEPMTIEYSLDKGKNWFPINDGAYDKADDGAEDWTVPPGRGFGMFVRVTAVDATGASTVKKSVQLARGVAGYVAQSTGTLHAFGSADGSVDERVRSTHWLFGVAINDAGTKGYTMDARGNVFPFSVGGASKPPSQSKLNLKWGWARDVVMRTDSSGYVLDKKGGIHRFGGAPKAKPSKTWGSCGCAVALALLDNGKGGYVLATNGKLYPFKVGGNAMPKSIAKQAFVSKGDVRDFVLNGNEKSGYVLRATGKMIPFGGASGVKAYGTGSSRDAQALLRVTNTGGYWVDHRGKLYRYGVAVGDPTGTVLAARTARGAVTV